MGPPQLPWKRTNSICRGHCLSHGCTAGTVVLFKLCSGVLMVMASTPLAFFVTAHNHHNISQGELRAIVPWQFIWHTEQVHDTVYLEILIPWPLSWALCLHLILFLWPALSMNYQAGLSAPVCSKHVKLTFLSICEQILSIGLLDMMNSSSVRWDREKWKYTTRISVWFGTRTPTWENISVSLPSQRRRKLLLSHGLRVWFKGVGTEKWGLLVEFIPHNQSGHVAELLGLSKGFMLRLELSEW